MPTAPEDNRTRKSMPAPMEKATNGMIRRSPGARNSRALSERFPKTKPKNIGKIAATKAQIGNCASPAAPSATMVKKGPSLIDNTAIEPRPGREPKCWVRGTKREPVEYDKEET